ncbi:hypothetical protein D9M73_70920 [compost metagenome]
MTHEAIAILVANILTLAAGAWIIYAVVLTVLLYYGYGFAMAGRKGKLSGDSQRMVVKIDTVLSFPVVLLDALYNLTVLPVVMFDFRWKHTWNLATGRLNLYTSTPGERHFRVWLANLYAAFLNGKDKDHIKNVTMHFAWLD